MTFGQRVYKVRTERGMTQDELAQRLGYKSRSSIAKIENGTRDVPRSLVVKLSEALDTTPSFLMGWEDEPAKTDMQVLADKYDNIHPIKLKKFPMLGEIACGEPIYADEDRESYVMAGMDINADFCLTAKGDSMINARINDGDIVFIRKQDMVENGEIAAVIIEDEATLKRVYYDREDNFLQLVAENPKYKPLIYRDQQLDQIHILGKAVFFMSAL